LFCLIVMVLSFRCVFQRGQSTENILCLGYQKNLYILIRPQLQQIVEIRVVHRRRKNIVEVFTVDFVSLISKEKSSFLCDSYFYSTMCCCSRTASCWVTSGYGFHNFIESF
jgi:hypothetical protein